MRGAARWIAAGVLLSLLLPVAAAAEATATGLRVSGPSRVDASPDALFAIADGRGLVWTATAASIVVERRYTNYTSVQHPLYPDTNLGRQYGTPVHETIVYQQATLVGGRAAEGGALLVRPAAAGALGSAAFPRELAALPVTGAEIAQSGEAAASSGEDADYSIHDRLAGELIRLDGEGGEFTWRGTLVVRVFGVDYAIESPQGSASMRTGDAVERDTGGVQQGRVESARITLVDAVLHVQAPGAAQLYATSARLAFQGRVEATQAEGDLVLASARRTTTPAGATRLDGEGELRLESRGAGLVLAGAQAPRAFSPLADARSSILFAAVAGLAVAAIVATAWLLTRRRRRFDDELGAALLAMEEKRFGEAIAPLQRALLRRPHDPLVNLDLAICLEETSRLQDARRQYETTLRLAPANAEALYYYARVLARLRLAAESEAHLREALVLDPRLEEMARREAAFRGFTGVQA